MEIKAEINRNTYYYITAFSGQEAIEQLSKYTHGGQPHLYKITFDTSSRHNIKAELHTSGTEYRESFNLKDKIAQNISDTFAAAMEAEIKAKAAA